jgi:hypothetical protein
MSDQLFAPPRLATSTASFSIYVSASNEARIHQAALVGDAVTVSGKKGPAVVRKLRRAGFRKPVLFDGMGYAGVELPGADAWVESQRAAGADRTLLPGAYLPWDSASDAQLQTITGEQSLLARALGAGALIAIDARWLRTRYEDLTAALGSMGCPISIVLADAGDPLSKGRAVEGLRWLATRVPHLSMLRSDHGAIGAVAFGAVHASIGLSASTRHLVPPTESGWANPSKSARVFVRALLDWYLADNIAGWSAAGVPLTCPLVCCRGQSVARYFDPQLNADWHNINALADFADFVLNAERQDRSGLFIDACRQATSLYGLAGMHGPSEPKAQLSNWALS